MTTSRIAVVFALLALIPSTGAWAETPAIDLKPVSYKQLEEALAARRGKIVVLDVWAEY